MKDSSLIDPPWGIPTFGCVIDITISPHFFPTPPALYLGWAYSFHRVAGEPYVRIVEDTHAVPYVVDVHG